MQEFIKPKGVVSVTLFDKDGNIKDERIFNNLVVAAGNTFIAARMTGTGVGVMSHLAVGSNNTAANTSDTALGTEIERVAVTSAISSGGAVTYTATFGAGVGTGTLQEAGLFNQSSGGTMLARTVFSTITKGASDIMNISWTITVG